MANAKEGDIRLIEGNRFILRNGKWRPEGKGEFGSEANTRKANRELKKLRDSNAARNGSKAKPAAKKPAVGNIPPSEGTGRKAETTLGYGSGKPKPKPSPVPSTSRSSTSRSTQSASTATKPQPAANAGMKNQDKNYRGNPEKAGSVANTLKELRGMGSGRKVSGTGPVASGSDYAKGVTESKSSKPSDKSRYVSPDGRPYAGPAYGADKQKSATGQSVGGTKTPSQTNKEAKKPMTLAEKIRRRRMGLD